MMTPSHKTQMVIDRLTGIGLSVRADKNSFMVVKGNTKDMDKYIEGTRDSITEVFENGTHNYRNYTPAVIPDMELGELIKAIDLKYGTSLMNTYAQEIKDLDKYYMKGF
ncbi:hypothetical protein D3C85_1109270 [compost metagenome]